MKKTVVRFKRSDGLEPKVVGDVITLRAPWGFFLDPDQVTTVSLGVEFDLTLLVYQSEGTAKRGVELFRSPFVTEPGQVTVSLRNVSNERQFFERGDVLAKAVPIGSSKLELLKF